MEANAAMEDMSFEEALKKLNIEDYAERIFNSSSRGELFYIFDYIRIANHLNNEESKKFREWFERIVEEAKKKWKRPESVFQHVLRIFNESVGTH